MVKYWRQNSIDIVLYLDDGFGLASDYKEWQKDSDFVKKKSLIDAVFLVNIEKSVFEPTQKLEWLGITWDSIQFCISISARRLNDLSVYRWNCRKTFAFLCQAISSSDW